MDACSSSNCCFGVVRPKPGNFQVAAWPVLMSTPGNLCFSACFLAHRDTPTLCSQCGKSAVRLVLLGCLSAWRQNPKPSWYCCRLASRVLHPMTSKRRLSLLIGLKRARDRRIRLLLFQGIAISPCRRSSKHCAALIISRFESKKSTCQKASRSVKRKIHSNIKYIMRRGSLRSSLKLTYTLPGRTTGFSILVSCPTTGVHLTDCTRRC